MKHRRLYWRKKGKGIILEGRTEANKPLLIWTLPDANKFYATILANASFLTQEKRDEIHEKVKRLGFRADKLDKNGQEVPLINITRTPEDTQKETLKRELTEEEKKLLWEVSK